MSSVLKGRRITTKILQDYLKEDILACGSLRKFELRESKIELENSTAQRVPMPLISASLNLMSIAAVL